MHGTPHSGPDDEHRDGLLWRIAGFLARSPNATQSQIAHAAGVSRATLHRLFAGKDSLVDELLARAEATVLAAASAARLEETPAEDALRRLVAELTQHSAYMALLYTLHKEGDPHEESDAWRQADGMIVSFFEQGQRDGSFAPQLTAGWMAESLYALTAAGEWAVQSGRCAPRDVATLVFESFWNGAKPNS